MKFLRHLPRIVYNHKCSVLIFLPFLIFLYFLYHWRFLCTNIEPWQHVSNLCHQYKKELVVGDICWPLCMDRKISSFSCQTFHAGKEIVFSAITDKDMKLIFKQIRQTVHTSKIYWTDENGVNHYPSELDFQQLIMSHVSSTLNTTIGLDRAKIIGRFSSNPKVKLRSQQRHQEMQQIWSLLQDNEYLISIVFAEKEVFPRVIGSCGQYFAVEYLEPALEGYFSNVMVDDHNKADWTSRVHLSVLILDLLEEIDSLLVNGLSLCDIKPAHFGISANSGKMKFLDLDTVYPKAVVNTITADGRSCRTNSDCHMFDCRSKCNYAVHRCDNVVTNNNLQVVCEKIFVGWRLSGSVIIPGLLMTPLTPPTLSSLLRQCSDPDVDGNDYIYPTPSQHVKERLFATLIEIDRMLAIHNYK